MGNENSSAVGRPSGVTEAEQDSTHANGSAPRARSNMQLVQNVLLIWLDSNIDDDSTDCRNTIMQLRRVVNTINTFTDGEECIGFIENMNDDKACMIVSGSLGQHIVPHVHNMSQLDSIFIFCSDKKYHEQWTKEWSKIKGTFTDISSICEALKKAAQQCEQNAMPISFMATNDDFSEKKLNQLEPSYMYTQMIKEILLTIVFEQKHFIEFIEFCREVLIDNEGQLENVTKLERKYRDETPIWWYTFECFLYPMLNRALRLMDVDIIIKIGFFINDLHHHIEQLHKQQFGGDKSNKRFTVYRGQGMSKTDFEQLTKSKGGLLSFNNFLSTSKNRDVSLNFARRVLSNPDSVGILFVMTIDPSQSTTHFASINDVDYYKDTEDEVLFAMHTVFRIHNITPMGENHHLFQVELTLTSDNDKDLCVLADRLQEQTKELTEWDRLGEVLIIMGQSKKAQELYEILLSQTTNDGKKARIYHQIAKIKWYLGEHKGAIIFNEKALKIRKRSLPSNHPDLAKSYNNIGLVYCDTGNYSKALSYYKKDLEISQQLFPPNHLDLALSYSNIGIVYVNMGDYLKALASHEKALEIQKQSLPPNHPGLATSYNNIGNVYKIMGDYSKALSSHEKALEIRKQSLPLNHPDLAQSYNNIGNVYYDKEAYSKALSFYEKALEIQKQSLPPNHPNMATSYDSIGNVYSIMHNDSKARSFYERAVDIAQRSLPSNHPNRQKWKRNLDRVKNL